jgi:hypothetical protein
VTDEPRHLKSSPAHTFFPHNYFAQYCKREVPDGCDKIPNLDLKASFQILLAPLHWRQCSYMCLL